VLQYIAVPSPNELNGMRVADSKFRRTMYIVSAVCHSVF